jgi:Fic family protein
MSDLERFLNDERLAGLPPLVFVALAHYQFETIHPFPDGNGRVGRLLIPLILKAQGLMDQPLLYMSQFFEDNKDEYVDLMLLTSQQSAWEGWVTFFLRAVIESCDKTIETIRQVRELQEAYKQRCQQARSSALLLQIVDSLFERIAVTVPAVRDMTGTSYTAAQNNVRKLVDYGIVSPDVSGRKPRFYFAKELMRIFEN